MRCFGKLNLTYHGKRRRLGRREIVSSTTAPCLSWRRYLQIINTSEKGEREREAHEQPGYMRVPGETRTTSSTPAPRRRGRPGRSCVPRRLRGRHRAPQLESFYTVPKKSKPF